MSIYDRTEGFLAVYLSEAKSTMACVDAWNSLSTLILSPTENTSTAPDDVPVVRSMLSCAGMTEQLTDGDVCIIKDADPAGIC